MLSNYMNKVHGRNARRSVSGLVSKGVFGYGGDRINVDNILRKVIAIKSSTNQHSRMSTTHSNHHISTVVSHCFSTTAQQEYNAFETVRTLYR